MKTLQLSLKRDWFEMTKSGVKTEDYREINAYWCSRLLLFDGKKKSMDFWHGRLEFFPVSNLTMNNYITAIVADTNKMTLGYPIKTDTSRILIFKHDGIEINTGKPQWGAEPGKLYFVVKHGKRIKPLVDHI